jgi:hypothetical protein
MMLLASGEVMYILSPVLHSTHRYNVP